MLAQAGALALSHYIDVKLVLLPHAQRELRFWERLRVYLGTREVLARLVLMDIPILEPGGEAYAQLRLEGPVSVKRGDPFVVRFFSPIETLGGGMVIDPQAERHGKSPVTLVALKQKERGDPATLVALFIEAHPGTTREELQHHLTLDSEQTQALLDHLKSHLVTLGAGLYHQQTMADYQADLLALLYHYHHKHPFKKGMSKEELREKMGRPVSQKTFQTLVKHFEAQGVFVSEGSLIRAHDFAITYTGEALRVKTAIETKVEAAGYNLPSAEALTGGDTLKNDVLESLIGQGLRKLGTLVIHERYYTQAEALVQEVATREGGITLAQFRDLIGTSRKYALALLDDMDRRKITQMVGNQRVILYHKS